MVRGTFRPRRAGNPFSIDEKGFKKSRKFLNSPRPTGAQTEKFSSSPGNPLSAP